MHYWLHNLLSSGSLVTFPILFRLCYVGRVGSIIKAFYSDSDEQLAKSKERKFIILIFILVAFIFLTQFSFILGIIFSHDLRRYACSCVLVPSAFNVFTLVFGGVIYSLEILAYLRYSCSLCHHRTRLRYKIKQELIVLSLTCIFLKLISFYFQTIARCKLSLLISYNDLSSTSLTSSTS